MFSGRHGVSSPIANVMLLATKCLRMYDNRYFHNSLSRTDALRLLTFAETGTIPKLTQERKARLLEKVARSVNLVYRDVRTDLGDPSCLRIEKEASRGHVEVESVFLETSPTPHPRITEWTLRSAQSQPVPLTDYDIVHRLPWVIEQINAAVREA